MSRPMSLWRAGPCSSTQGLWSRLHRGASWTCSMPLPGITCQESGPHFQQLVRGASPLQVPRNPLQLFGSQGILFNQQEVGATRAARLSPSFGTVLHPWDHIQESLRPKSPSFVPDVRTGGLYWGEGNVSIQSGRVGHFNMEASMPKPNSSARRGPGKPKAKDNCKAASALKMFLTDFLTHTHTHK